MILDSKKVLDAISKIKQALGNELVNISLKFNPDNLTISAEGKKLSLAIVVDGCSGDEEFAIAAESFTYILGKRNQLEGVLENATLKFKNKNYRGEIQTLPYAPISVEAEQEQSTIRLDHNSGILKLFNEARGVLALSNPIDTSKEMFLCVALEKKELTCAVYDQVHAGVYRTIVSDYVGKDIFFTIFDSTLRKVLSITKNAERYDLTIGPNIVYVQSENIKASLATQQVQAAQFKNLIAAIDQVRKGIVISAPIESNRISAIVDNMMAIIESNKAIEFTLGDNVAHLRYVTSYGKIEEKLKTETKRPSKTGSKASKNVEPHKVLISPDLILDLAGVFPKGKIQVGISELQRGDKISRQVSFEIANVVYFLQTISRQG